MIHSQFNPALVQLLQIRDFPAAASALSPSDCEELLLDCPVASRQRSDYGFAF